MAFKMKAGKEGPMKKNFGSAMNFNAGLRAASKAGKLDNNPKFKSAVDSAPMKTDLSKRKRVIKEKEIDPQTGGTITYKRKYRKSGELKKYKIRDPKGEPGEKYSKMKKYKGGALKEGKKYGEKGPTGLFKMNKDNAPMMRMDASAMKKMGSPKKIDLKFSGGQDAKKEREATAKREFLENYKKMTPEEQAKIPKPVKEAYGV
tara:strand:+ start:532 stop:1140 length:609 start_codon:yes stop_codon:yes gene_type:complete